MEEKNHERIIHYTVNDEDQTTSDKKMTAVQIMTKTGIDPSKNYLIEIDGHKQKSFKDNPNDEIHMKHGMKFITNFTGPTPVSNY